jgi:hypothetical protein
MRTIKGKFKKVTSTRKGKATALIIFLVFIGIIGGGIWYWNTNKKSIIRNKLESAIAEKSKGFYKVKYDNMEIDEIAGFLSVTNMQLSYDTNLYRMAVGMGKTPSLLLSIQIPELTVTGVKTPKALLENEIVGSKLEIKNPRIDIQYTNQGKDSGRHAPTKEIYEEILGGLDLIHIDTVLISGAQITTKNLKTGKSAVEIQDVFIRMIDIKVDSTGHMDDSRYLFAKELSVNAGKVTWASGNKRYKYRLENLSLNSGSRDLTIEKFNMNPTMDEQAFVNSIPTQDDRFDFSFNRVSLRNIDLQKLFNEVIVSESLVINAASFKVYRDLAIPRDKVNRVGKYPHQVIDDIPLPFKIGKLILSNTFVEYKERNHISRESGKVQFYNVHATINNFTNDKKAIANNNVMTADVTSSFLNKTPLKTHWVFYILHPKGRFNVKGSMGGIDALQLNPLTEPMGPATIKKGKINALEFDLEGHDYGMDGSVKMLYDDLRVAMLEKDKGAKEMDKKFLTSFVANLIIKNENPKNNDDPRVVQVHFDRDTNRSIFHLLWKTIFKGIRETVGIKK